MVTLLFILNTLAYQNSTMRGLKVLGSEAPDYLALFIGVQSYQDPKIVDLQTPVADVTAIAEVLDRRFHFKSSKIVTDEEATEAGIRKAIQDLVNQADSEDSILIYFAGHGDKGSSLSGYWLPHDSVLDATDTYISNHDIVAYLESSKAKHALLIADSCFSGSVFINNTKNEHPLEYYRKYERKSRWAITSGNFEPVSDSGPSKKHSAFAYSLLKCLNEKREAYLTPSEILQTITSNVNRNSRGLQLPRGGPITGDKGGGFVFWNREGVRPDGGPAPPPWENPESEMVFFLKEKLKDRKIWVVNGKNSELCKKLVDLGLKVDCDDDYPSRQSFRMTIMTRCGQISSEAIVALRDHLGLESYAIDTHQNKPQLFIQDECGIEGEITIWN